MHNQTLDVRSFLMHRLKSGATGGDEAVITELQKFLELERQSRSPGDEESASVATLMPANGRHLRVIS